MSVKVGGTIGVQGLPSLITEVDEWLVWVLQAIESFPNAASLQTKYKIPIGHADSSAVVIFQ